jgi:hypothetical protein
LWGYIVLHVAALSRHPASSLSCCLEQRAPIPRAHNFGVALATGMNPRRKFTSLRILEGLF